MSAQMTAQYSVRFDVSLSSTSLGATNSSSGALAW
jgi:hypothetical protein